MKMVKGKGKKKVAPRKPKTTALVPIVEAVPEGKKLDSSDVQVNPQALLVQAIQKGLPLEAIERLLAMRKELKAEWAKEQYFTALSDFQAQCPNIIKDKDVFDRDGKFRYSYAPLDVIVTAVKDALQANGFSYTIITSQSEKDVTAECHAHHRDGHSEVSQFTIPMDPKAYMNESQKIASAMSYAKRYSFCNAFGIMTSDQDDDAQGTGEPKKESRKETPSPQPTAGVEVQENGKITREEGSAPKADVNAIAQQARELNAARSEVQTIFSRMAKKITTADNTEIMLYTVEELEVMKQQAKAATSDIEKLHSYALDWTADYTSRLADKGFGG
jgi:hypothetical protein